MAQSWEQNPGQGQPAQPGPGGGESPPPKRGCLMPGLWLGISTLITLGGLGFLGVMAAGSERDGVAAAQIVMGPLGFAWAGMFAAAIVHLFFKKAGAGVRGGVPVGCGCLGAITFLALMFVFFAVIWPEL